MPLIVPQNPEVQVVSLLVILLIGILITACAFWVAQALGLPHPIPLILALACIVIVILIAAGHVDASHA